MSFRFVLYHELELRHIVGGDDRRVALVEVPKMFFYALADGFRRAFARHDVNFALYLFYWAKLVFFAGKWGDSSRLPHVQPPQRPAGRQ